MNKYDHRKIGVFYDGNFLLHASNYYNYVHPQRKRLSLSGLHNYIRSKVAHEEEVSRKNCKITETHYFRGRINAAEASQRGNQLYNDRVFDDILMSEGIHTHYLPLRNLMGRKEERGIDVWLSLEVYELTVVRQLDVVVLIISDTDYVPLLRKLNSLGVSVMLLSWEFDYQNDEGAKVVTKTSHDLLQLATYPVFMHQIIDEGLKNNDPEIRELFVSGESRSFSAQVQTDARLIIDEDEVSEVSTVLSIKNGFGFISYPNNNLFFHYQDVLGEFTDLQPGDYVEFTVDKNNHKQDVAKRVRKLSKEEIKKGNYHEDEDWGLKW